MSRYPCLSSQNRSAYTDRLHDIEVFGYRYVISTICIFGVVCNILNLCVLLQRRLKESPYTYLTGLAIADMLTLILISPFSIVRGDCIRHENTFFTLTRFEAKFYMPLANYFGQVSIMITLALTTERYLFTTYPLHTRSFCKPRYARIIIAIILVVCALLSFPRSLLETVDRKIGHLNTFNSSKCSTHPFIITQSSNRSHIGQCFCVIGHPNEKTLPYRNSYYITMFIFNQILPAFILMFLNLKLIRRVQSANRFTLDELTTQQYNHRASASSITNPVKQKRLRDEHRLTKTLISVVVIFLICNTFTIVSYPNLVYKITAKTYPNYINVEFRIQKLITNIMLLLNYSINFFLYCAFNQKFLDTLKQTFLHRLCPCVQRDLYNKNESSAVQRTLFSSTTSSINSTYFQSKRRNSSRQISSNDEEKQQQRQRNLKVIKDIDCHM